MKDKLDRQQPPASIWSEPASNKLNDSAHNFLPDRTVVEGPEELSLPDVSTLLGDKPAAIRTPDTVDKSPEEQSKKAKKETEKETGEKLPPDGAERKQVESAIWALSRAGLISHQGGQYSVVDTADFTVDRPKVTTALSALPSAYSVASTLSASAVQALLSQINEAYPGGFGAGPQPENERKKDAVAPEKKEAEQPSATEKSVAEKEEAKKEEKAEADVTTPAVQQALKKEMTSGKEASQIYVTSRGVVTGVNESAIKNKAAYDIAYGPSWSTHQDQWRKMGIDSAKELAEHLEGIMKNPSDQREDSHKGRKAYWDEETKTLIIETASDSDAGTAYIPEDEKQAFYDLQ